MSAVRAATFEHSVASLELDPIQSPAVLDEESRTWLRDLRAVGPVRDAAVARLHALLIRAARFEAARRRGSMPFVREEELSEIALEAADDALVSILRKLDDFRGASRFTTWAYKFALLEAAVKLRKRAWQGREIPLEDDGWRALRDRAAATPAEQAQTSELLRAIGQAIEQDLTSHQRRVLVAVTLDGVPIDVLAERLGTTRGALYKTLHDARRRLRERLAARGFDIAGEESHP